MDSTNNNLKTSKDFWATLFVLVTNPDALGEALRDIVFVKKNKHDVGCYSTFDLTPNFKKVECPIILKKVQTKLKTDEIDNKALQVYQNEDGLLVAWLWESDGLLYFCYKKNHILNTDCKKNYGWDLI